MQHTCRTMLTQIMFVLAMLFALAGGALAQSQEQTYFEFQVTKPVRAAEGTKAPRYPPELKQAGTAGEIIVQFVVDTMGVPEMRSFRVLRSPHVLFAESVRAAVEQSVYIPAELNGRKVRQLVQQPFVFRIAGQDASVDAVMTMRPSPGGTARPDVFRNLPLTPKPSSGTVPGWWMEQRTTMDSANGASPVVSVVRISATAGRMRVELGRQPSRAEAAIVVLIDSAAGNVLIVMPGSGTVSVTPLGASDAVNLLEAVFTTTRTVTALGDGEAIAGVATRKFHVEGMGGTRLTAGNRVCTVERPLDVDVWTTTDKTVMAIEQQLNASATWMPRLTRSALAPRDTTWALPGARMRSVGRTAYTSKDGTPGTLTATVELSAFGSGTLDAALFEPPEGYRRLESSTPNAGARADSLSRVLRERMLTRLIDSTAVAPGERRNCTTRVP